jgi:hypothetical protein
MHDTVAGGAAIRAALAQGGVQGVGQGQKLMVRQGLDQMIDVRLQDAESSLGYSVLQTSVLMSHVVPPFGDAMLSCTGREANYPAMVPGYRA